MYHKGQLIKGPGGQMAKGSKGTKKARIAGSQTRVGQTLVHVRTHVSELIVLGLE